MHLRRFGQLAAFILSASVCLGQITTSPNGVGLPLGINGATSATRYVGGTASTSPATGTFLIGDFVVDQGGKIWVCTSAGTPGTWLQANTKGAILKTADGTTSIDLSGTGGSSVFAYPMFVSSNVRAAVNFEPNGNIPLSFADGDLWLYKPASTSARFSYYDAYTTTVQTIVTRDDLPAEFCIALSDETTDLTTGTAKVTWRAPYAFTITAVRASVNHDSSSGFVTVDINESGTTILSTKLSIDANEKTSTTAATPVVISDTAIADDAEITMDIDAAGTGAKGLKVWIIGHR